MANFKRKRYENIWYKDKDGRISFCNQVMNGQYSDGEIDNSFLGFIMFKVDFNILEIADIWVNYLETGEIDSDELYDFENEIDCYIEEYEVDVKNSEEFEKLFERIPPPYEYKELFLKLDFSIDLWNDSEYSEEELIEDSFYKLANGKKLYLAKGGEHLVGIVTGVGDIRVYSRDGVNVDEDYNIVDYWEED